MLKIGAESAATSLATNLKKFIESEYKRVKRSSDRDHLVLLCSSEHNAFAPCSLSTVCVCNSVQLALVPAVQVFDEIVDMSPPPGIPINFTHIGTLYVLDCNVSGKITLAQMFSFIEFCDEQRKQYKSHEYRVSLYGMKLLCAHVPTSH